MSLSILFFLGANFRPRIDVGILRKNRLHWFSIEEKNYLFIMSISSLYILVCVASNYFSDRRPEIGIEILRQFFVHFQETNSHHFDIDY